MDFRRFLGPEVDEDDGGGDGEVFEAASTSMVVVDSPGACCSAGIGGPEAAVLKVNGEHGGAEQALSNVKEKLVTMWNSMKFGKALWSLEDRYLNSSGNDGRNHHANSRTGGGGGGSTRSRAGLNFMQFSGQSRFKRGLSRLNSNRGHVEPCPAWLLGECYFTQRSAHFLDDEVVDPDVVEVVVSAHSKDGQALYDFEADFYSRIWMTYRQDFEPFRSASPRLTSDCGWGCMIRAGQMIVSNALQTLHLGREWRCRPPVWDEDDDRFQVLTGDELQTEDVHRSIIRLFADRYRAPFSIQKIVEIGQSTMGSKPGDWFGPGATAHLLRQALDSAAANGDEVGYNHHLLDGFRIYVATDSTVYKGDVLDLCSPGNARRPNRRTINSKQTRTAAKSLATPGRRPDPDAGASSPSSFSEVVETRKGCYSFADQTSHQSFVDRASDLRLPPEQDGSFETLHPSGVPVDPDDGSSGETWTPLLLLIPVRLGGGEKLNPLYAGCLKALLACEMSVGVIGGRPKHALYFVGFQEDQLFYLDPHLLQDSLSDFDADFDVSTYHCSSVRKIGLSKVDPCCCLGFLCRTESEFRLWCRLSPELATPVDGSGGSGKSPVYPIFSIVEGRASDLLADNERLLNQMQLLEVDTEGDCGDGDRLQRHHQHQQQQRSSKDDAASGTAPKAGSPDSDNEDFVFL